MPIDVDRSRSPRLLVYRFSGPAPARQAQAELREALITEGHLTAETGALIDLRGLDDSGADLETTIALAAPAGGWPHQRAYVVVPWMHLPVLRLMQGREADTVVMSAFLDEPSALAWLEERGAK
ncbi:MAG: hypothetical protein AB7P34_00415 [Vicinamibacterales bacterium]